MYAQKFKRRFKNLNIQNSGDIFIFEEGINHNGFIKMLFSSNLYNVTL
jgi:hypothetical protein